jgi:hypothetical protein
MWTPAAVESLINCTGEWAISCILAYFAFRGLAKVLFGD